LKSKFAIVLLLIVLAAGLLFFNSRQNQIAPATASNFSPLSKRPSAHRPTTRHAEPPSLEPQTNDLPTRNLIGQLLADGDAPKLTRDQIEAYLTANHRSAESLLAAFRALGDSAFLQEALEKYPNDPRVNFAAVFKADAASAERRQYLEALKQSAPENALPNYLSAMNYFKAGQNEQALQEIAAASGKQTFQDYSSDFIQAAEEAYLAAGYSVAEAKVLASSQLLLPHLTQLRDLGLKMVDLAKAYRFSGDETSAQATLDMVMNLGQRYHGAGGEALVSQLVGISIERMALTSMDAGKAKERFDQLGRQMEAIKELDRQLTRVRPLMTDNDWINYKDRWRSSGEEAAVRWAVAKYGDQGLEHK
jgi:hypothetical protein